MKLHTKFEVSEFGNFSDIFKGIPKIEGIMSRRPWTLLR